MMGFNVKKLCAIFLLWNCFYQGTAWDYQDLNAWGAVAPICNTGSNQSPIDLRPDVLGQNSGNRALQFLNYTARPRQFSVNNEGHTIQLTGAWQANAPSITGSVFSDEVYTFSNAHVHWGTQDTNGTEHSINGQKFACELHLVHINRKYRNLTEATNRSDGIAVIGVLFQVNDNFAPNPGMEIFSSQTQTVLNTGSTNAVGRFDLSLFLPKPIKSFFSYSGSLTTPPCAESVRWIVVADPQPITSEIITRLRSISLENNDPSNIRTLQQINNRLVEFYEQK
ncbi:carbonic anhydrase 1 [Nasonia vitripennis]|uniref:carbonic anhydrase n=1 Tax=Nasonia vitripennis TaxID=7425 RepID=A0A7M7H5G5_NASVI|nr:carbonic anhydrase 1 [Nasonia vitripennis]